MSSGEILFASINSLILAATAIFIFLTIKSPIKAVKVGRQLNDEQNKYLAKRNLFFTLYSLRGSPVHYNFVTGLNQIDVIFHDTPLVLNTWHNYFQELQTTAKEDERFRIRELLRVELLSQMANAVDYVIPQTNIMQDYYPVGLDNLNKADLELRGSALSFLKNGDTVYKILIDQSNKTTQENIQPDKTEEN